MESKFVGDTLTAAPVTEPETAPPRSGPVNQVDRIDLTPILMRRRWRQGAQVGLFLLLFLGLSDVTLAAFVLRRGGLSGVWGVVTGAVILVGLLIMLGTLALIAAVNRGRPLWLSIARTLTVVFAILCLAGGGLLIAKHGSGFLYVYDVASNLAIGVVLAAISVPGTIVTARSLRKMAAGGREGLLNSLVLGQGRMRDLLGKRPELSRVPAWHLYLAIGLTFALVFGIELALGFPHSALAIAVENVGGILLWVVVSLAIRRYINSRMVDMAQVLDADPRPPVLYLRSFSSDHAKVRKIPRLYPDFAGQTYRISIPYDEFVGEALTQAGPVIAIGEPGRASKTTNVATAHFDDSIWQEKALELMRSAGVIVMLAGRTGGVQWEIEQLAANRQLSKTVFLLPKSTSSETEAEWQRICEILEQHGVTGLRGSVDVNRTVAVLPQENGDAITISVRRKSAPAYALAIRAALVLRARPEGALARVVARTRWRLRIPLLICGTLVALVAVVGGPLGAVEAYDHSTVTLNQGY